MTQKYVEQVLWNISESLIKEANEEFVEKLIFECKNCKKLKTCNPETDGESYVSPGNITNCSFALSLYKHLPKSMLCGRTPDKIDGKNSVILYSILPTPEHLIIYRNRWTNRVKLFTKKTNNNVR